MDTMECLNILVKNYLNCPLIAHYVSLEFLVFMGSNDNNKSVISSFINQI